MTVSTIGVQLIQPVSGTPQQPSVLEKVDDAVSDERVTPTAPVQAPPAPGTGQFVDKTV